MDQQKKITVSELKKQFPSPETSLNHHPPYSLKSKGYCVGGALCKALNMERPYPANSVLGHTIQRANPNLAAYPEVAFDYAEKVIWLNDLSEFEDAWAALDKALRWVP